MNEIESKKYRKKNSFSVKCAKSISTIASISFVLFLLFNYPPQIHAVAGSNKKISDQSERKNTKVKKRLKNGKGKQEKTKHKDSSDKKEKELKREKKSAEWIEKTLEYGIQTERKEALNKIITIKDKGIRKGLESKLIAIIRDEINPEVKTKAITVAGQLELKEALPELIAALNDKSDDVKVASVYAIKKIHDTSATETLIKALKKQDLSKDSRLVEALIDTLGKFKAAQLGNFAIESIKDGKTRKNIRASLVLFLGKTGSVESKNFLLQLLKDNDEEQQIRAYAASSLAQIGARDAAKEINDIISDNSVIFVPISSSYWCLGTWSRYYSYPARHGTSINGRKIRTALGLCICHGRSISSVDVNC